MNSTVGPIFNEKIAEKWNLWVREQCTVCIDWLKRMRKVKLYGYCSCTVQWTIAAKFDFSHSFHPISAHCALFTNSQISLFSNFFIKNGSYGTIHTFKNNFTTVFFSFQFQFSVFSFQLYPNGPLISKYTSLLWVTWYFSINLKAKPYRHTKVDLGNPFSTN